ncbi:MAG: Gfo/Idh/MocA family oxidoreductase [Chthonomonas sp.]|nr:Gfo/Idh/MocA family oxidoreductase [Chthonomonas sp.]
MQTLTLGLVGAGFMGRAHSNAYRQVNRFFDLPRQVRMKTICGIDAVHVEAARVQLGWETGVTRWQDLLEDPEIDVIDVAAPGDLHAEISIAAARAGKGVWCEKALANTLAEAEQMVQAVDQAGVHHGLFHNYRKLPAVALAKRLIEQGRLGEIRHWRSVYLQDWLSDPAASFNWRMQRSTAGSGALADLGSHSIDLARYLVGEISNVTGRTKTFVTERTVGPGGERGEVDVPDAAMWMVDFANGAIGSFEVSRCALGRKNHNRFEINGTRGSLAFNLERLNELEFYDGSDEEGSQGFRVIQATEGSHPYAGQFWPVGHGLGYEHSFVNWVADAVMAFHEGRPTSPNFHDGLAVQRVLDAVER